MHACSNKEKLNLTEHTGMFNSLGQWCDALGAISCIRRSLLERASQN